MATLSVMIFHVMIFLIINLIIVVLIVLANVVMNKTKMSIGCNCLWCIYDQSVDDEDGDKDDWWWFSWYWWYLQWRCCGTWLWCKDKFETLTQTDDFCASVQRCLMFMLLSPLGDLGIGLVWDNLSGPHHHFSVRLLKSSSNWTKSSMIGPQLFLGWYQMILDVQTRFRLGSD